VRPRTIEWRLKLIRFVKSKPPFGGQENYQKYQFNVPAMLGQALLDVSMQSVQNTGQKRFLKSALPLEQVLDGFRCRSAWHQGWIDIIYLELNPLRERSFR
jgi:hypothetical protein